MKINKASIFFLSSIASVVLSLEANARCAFVQQDYRPRDSNRYREGVLTRIRINSDFKLVSFAIHGETKDNESKFYFKIPKQTEDKPNILVREFEKEYLLDNVTLSSRNKDFYNFQWSKCVIKKAKVDIDRLRFLAIASNSEETLLPTIFGEGGGKYNFIFRTPQPTVIKSFQIKREEHIIYQTSNESQIGEIMLTWDGKDESKTTVGEGIYNLFIDAEIRHIDGWLDRVIASKYQVRICQN